MPTYGTTESSTSPVQLELDLHYEPDPVRHQRLADFFLAPVRNNDDLGSHVPSRSGGAPVSQNWNVNETVDYKGRPEFVVRYVNPHDRTRWAMKRFTDKKKAEEFARRVQG